MVIAHYVANLSLVNRGQVEIYAGGLKAGKSMGLVDLLACRGVDGWGCVTMALAESGTCLHWCFWIALFFFGERKTIMQNLRIQHPKPCSAVRRATYMSGKYQFTNLARNMRCSRSLVNALPITSCKRSNSSFLNSQIWKWNETLINIYIMVPVCSKVRMCCLLLRVTSRREPVNLPPFQWVLLFLWLVLPWTQEGLSLAWRVPKHVYTSIYIHIFMCIYIYILWRTDRLPS